MRGRDATPSAAPRLPCTGSGGRVAHMLRRLGRDGVDGIVVEQGEVEVTGGFCG